MNVLLIAVSALFSFGEVKLDCTGQEGWTAHLKREIAGEGVEIARIVLESEVARRPPEIKLAFTVPQVDISCSWNVNRSGCHLPPNWGSEDYTELCRGLPVNVFLNGNNRNRIAISASECSRRVRFRGGVREEGSLMEFSLSYFGPQDAPLSRYETAVRIDRRNVYFGDVVRDGVAWIEKESAIRPCAVPESAFDPLYSTWYCFHQDVFDRDIEAELEIAAKLGMKTVILDDGWQTDDTGRGYAYCGDWKVSPRRFPDMAAHVAKAHQLGMKYMIWYSVPFIGSKSANYERFKGKYLFDVRGGSGAAVLDPRFPEVRKFLIDTYVAAVKDWDLDGLKLDFIDEFRIRGTDPAIAQNYAGRDIKSVPLAVEKLMTDVYTALSAVKPEVLIEFRQSYIGASIRRFGNMLRVGDCPGDARRNRIAIANLRLASGTAAVHADMLEWNFSEPPEKSALFIINSIFGVVQYSVMLRKAPKEHLAMIEKWIRFSQEHRDTLLKGRFTPLHPELSYPVITAESDRELIVGLYDDGRVIDVPEGKKTFVMNASGSDVIVIRRGGKLSEVKCASGDYIEL